MDSNLDPFSDHPLFRALVLMGGGLALGCGGIAQSDHQGTSSGAGAPDHAVGGGGSGSASSPTIIIGEPASSGATSTGGAPSTDVDAGVPPVPDCPYAQWDCTTKQPVCYLSLASASDPVQAKCFCNASRPRTSNDCGNSQSIVCLQAYVASATPGWDGSVHVQCSCVNSPPSYDNCGTICAQTFAEDSAGINNGRFLTCILPSNPTCDAQRRLYRDLRRRIAPGRNHVWLRGHWPEIATSREQIAHCARALPAYTRPHAIGLVGVGWGVCAARGLWLEQP
jgi:hypothetical protein